MAKKAEIQPSDCVLTLPCAFCHDVMSLIASCVIYRPVFTAFLCSSVTFAYFMANVPKMQHYVVSFPYEKYISKIINHKMITMYAALLEIVVELLMAVVLAGVSLTVTLWLLFEEVTERKKRVYQANSRTIIREVNTCKRERSEGELRKLSNKTTPLNCSLT